MHTVSGICQRLIQKDQRINAAGTISDFLHLIATRETRRALEQGKASTSRELEALEKRIYLLVAQFIEQKASMQTATRVQANGKLGIKQTRNVAESALAVGDKQSEGGGFSDFLSDRRATQ
jgi:hypothetical protein